MAKRRHTAEQIIAKLREAEVLLSKGTKLPQVCRKLGVTEQTYYRWRKECLSAFSSCPAPRRSRLPPMLRIIVAIAAGVVTLILLLGFAELVTTTALAVVASGLIAVAVTAVIIATARRHAPPGHCQRCGYSLAFGAAPGRLIGAVAGGQAATHSRALADATSVCHRGLS